MISEAGRGHARGELTPETDISSGTSEHRIARRDHSRMPRRKTQSRGENHGRARHDGSS